MKKAHKYGIAAATVAISGMAALALVGMPAPGKGDTQDAPSHSQSQGSSCVVTIDYDDQIRRDALGAEYEASGDITAQQVHNALLLNPEKRDNILVTYELAPMSETDAVEIYSSFVQKDYEMLQECTRGGSMGDEEASETYRKAATAYVATANYYMTHEYSKTDRLKETDEALLSELSEIPEMDKKDATWQRIGGFGRQRIVVNCRPYVQFMSDEALELFEGAVDGDEVHVSEAMLDAFKLTKEHVWRQQMFLVGYKMYERDERERIVEVLEEHLNCITYPDEIPHLWVFSLHHIS